MRAPAVFLLLTLLLGGPVSAETVIIEADRDATLIEDPDGELANGGGPLFVGRTAQDENGVRRALLHFDVAAALPEQAIIEDVSLTLHMLPSHPEVRRLRLYRVLADWGEGPSFSGGGGGAQAEPGDATWLHTFYDYDFWVHSGGQFVGRSSATLEVGDSDFCTWEGGSHLVQDVRLWNAAPHRNFGWILTGDETTYQSVKSFASREHADPVLRPALAVTYRLPGNRRSP
jgi:hypothetical protein